MLRYSQSPEQQPDVPLPPAMRLFDLLSAPCTYPVTRENGFQFHSFLLCDIALTLCPCLVAGEVYFSHQFLRTAEIRVSFT